MTEDRSRFTFHDLMRVRRIGESVVHPMRRLVAFEGQDHNPVADEVYRSLYLWDIHADTVSELTPGSHADTSPRWSPDGTLLAFVSDREEGEQLWLLPFARGGEARRITAGPGGVRGPVWAPDSRRMAFSRRVTLSRSSGRPLDEDALEALPADLEESRRRRALAYELTNPRSSACVSDTLLYRHWNAWRHNSRNHLFLLDTADGASRDITEGPVDVPPLSLGGSQDFVFAPDGAEIAFIMNPDEEVSLSTNNSLFVQAIEGIRPAGDPLCLSENEAMELEPRYSPDGRHLAFLGAERAGYEADQLRVKLYDRTSGLTRVLTEDLDRSVGEYAWLGSEQILFLAADAGYRSLYDVSLSRAKADTAADGSWTVSQLTRGVYQSRLGVLSESGEQAELLVLRESASRPPELTVLALDSPASASGEPAGDTLRVSCSTRINAAILEDRELPALQSFRFPGADDDPVHGFLLTPPGFDAGGKYPLLYLIHGGPQGAFSDNFHFRWNAQVFASAGFVVAMTNPRGSVGYGQGFTDQISGDWSGRCYRDLMRGVDYLLETCEFLDESRLAAAGGSFGGYMINWIAGHSTRFAALVSHDGIFNQESMSYTTDELWFDVWEHDGMPYENPDSIRRQSPHRYVENFRTPMLVVQGEKDYRCPVSEGVALFTALQVRGVPSRFLYFPDEGHFVTRPANAQVWYEELIRFLGEHVGGSA